MLIAIPQGELFLTGSSVEVFRLIRTRWNVFSEAKQEAILRRLCDGPPRDWYQQDPEIDKYIDRARFDILAEMERDGFALSTEAKAVLSDIRACWPKWQLRSPAQAGFHLWHSSSHRIEGDSKKLEGVPKGALVAEAKRLAAAANFLDGDDWQALCLRQPDRAVRGLEAAPEKGDWTPELWEQLLFSRKEYAEPDTEQRIAELLLRSPADGFEKIAPASSSWLNEHAKTLADAVLWPLWDRIAEAVVAETEEPPDA
jgi:hypothetical protein